VGVLVMCVCGHGKGNCAEAYGCLVWLKAGKDGGRRPCPCWRYQEARAEASGEQGETP
jgi:hypothetical protein